MDSPTRTLAKAVSWQLLGLVSMTLIGYLFTGSVTAAGSLAGVAAVAGAGCYVLHERLWNRVAWGRRGPPGGVGSRAAPAGAAARRRLSARRGTP